MKGILAIYDSGPDFFDRYCIYYDEPGSRSDLKPYVSASEHPFNPLGFGQHGEGQLGPHNGKRIIFKKLPLDVQCLVKQDLDISRRNNPARRGKKSLRYHWYEGASAYYIVDTVTNKEACMGDGVDMLSTESGKILSPGTKSFDHAMNVMVRGSQRELGEAYFDVYD